VTLSLPSRSLPFESAEDPLTPAFPVHTSAELSLTPPRPSRNLHAMYVASGEILEVGPGVEGLKKGDHVAMEAGIPCGQCEFCRIGRYNACSNVRIYFLLSCNTFAIHSIPADELLRRSSSSPPLPTTAC